MSHHHQYGFQSQYNPSGGNLSVPHTQHVHGLPPHSMVTIMGQVPRHCDRFDINLLSHRGDVLLHVNPRFDQGKVVRNSLLNGSWGPEETAGGLPLHKGHPFGCIILVSSDKFMIAFNGAHFTEYQFRAPADVKNITVNGDVVLNSVNVSSNPSMPSHRPAVPIVAPSWSENTIYTPVVPFKAKIGGGMMHGRSVTLSCLPKHSPQRIRIDLQKDSDGTEIALHMDIRFDVDGHKRIVCMNSYKFGHWGDEARYHQFPFQAGVGFDLVITSEPAGYVIFVNGAQLAFFEHREHHLANVSYLHVQGDLKITRVTF